MGRPRPAVQRDQRRRAVPGPGRAQVADDPVPGLMILEGGIAVLNGQRHLPSVSSRAGQMQ